MRRTKLQTAQYDVQTAERNALFVARHFLANHADRNDLRAALAHLDRCLSALSRIAGFTSPTSRGVGGRGGYVFEAGDPSETGTNHREPDAKLPNPTERSEVGTSKSTWLSVYCAAYREIYGENATQVTIRRMARTMKQLEAEHSREEIVTRYRRYLSQTAARFYSVEHFGSSFAGWREGAHDPDAWKHDPTAFRPGESHEAYIRRTSEG